MAMDKMEQLSGAKIAESDGVAKGSVYSGSYLFLSGLIKAYLSE